MEPDAPAEVSKRARTLRVELRDEWAGSWVELSLDRAKLAAVAAVSAGRVTSEGLSSIAVRSNLVDAAGKAIDITRAEDCRRVPVAVVWQIALSVTAAVAAGRRHHR
jgi:hypothetical protein